eukprot:121122-Prorocentrum_minimum.AAC.7
MPTSIQPSIDAQDASDNDPTALKDDGLGRTLSLLANYRTWDWLGRMLSEHRNLQAADPDQAEDHQHAKGYPPAWPCGMAPLAAAAALLLTPGPPAHAALHAAAAAKGTLCEHTAKNDDATATSASADVAAPAGVVAVDLRVENERVTVRLSVAPCSVCPSPASTHVVDRSASAAQYLGAPACHSVCGNGREGARAIVERETKKAAEDAAMGATRCVQA